MKQNNLTLDAGCGSGYYQIEDTNKRFQNQGHINIDILKPLEKIENFVLCDVHFLPFRNSCFYNTFFIEVLEHTTAPIKALFELKRVTRNFISLSTPNAIYFKKILRCFVKGKYEVFKDHDKTFGIPELENLFKKVGLEIISIKTSNYREKETKFYTLLSLLFPKIMKKRYVSCFLKT